jgi:phosphatidylglycerophosphatase A
MTISAVAPINAPASPQSSPKTTWAWTVATFFGAGYLKPGPGTWGSLGALLLYCLLAFRAPQSAPWIALALCLAATAVGIPAATLVARESGRHDPGWVVIDEVAGQALTLAASAFTWKYLILSFILFRGFDILKPWPVRRLEQLPEGTGIVVDDLGAAVYAAVIVLFIRHWNLL